LLHQKWRDHFGQDDDDVLVVQGASSTFNPLLTPEVIAAQRAADPEGALAELDAEFRTDISAFLDDALVEQAIDYGRPLELPPVKGRNCSAFVDASGGRHDHYTIAVGHKEGERLVIDLVRGAAPPFDPTEVTTQYATLLKDYNVTSVTGDNFAQEWVESAWRSCGVSCNRSEMVRSEIYLECLPSFTRGLVSLPDHPRLLRELRLLERHTHRSGRDTVDHGRHGSDDYANAVCGVLRQLSRGYTPMEELIMMVDGLEALKRYQRGEPIEAEKTRTPGWQRAGFKSREEAETFKAQYRARYGQTAQFPWDIG
jgi:hypothetical protein